MSRQYPSSQDIEYMIGWAERKIIYMMRKTRTVNFVNVADLARSVAFYLNTMEMVYDPSQNWLRRRISDTYYSLSEMRYREEGSEEFNQAENDLIKTLKYISEYYEENGFADPSFGSYSEFDISKVWHPPSRWLKDHSEEFDSLE